MESELIHSPLLTLQNSGDGEAAIEKDGRGEGWRKKDRVVAHDYSGGAGGGRIWLQTVALRWFFLFSLLFFHSLSLFFILLSLFFSVFPFLFLFLLVPSCLSLLVPQLFFNFFFILKINYINIDSIRKISDCKINMLKVERVQNTFEKLNSSKMMLKMLKTMQIYKECIFLGFSLFFAIFGFFKNLSNIGSKIG